MLTLLPLIKQTSMSVCYKNWQKDCIFCVKMPRREKFTEGRGQHPTNGSHDSIQMKENHEFAQNFPLVN